MQAEFYLIIQAREAQDNRKARAIRHRMTSMILMTPFHFNGAI